MKNEGITLAEILVVMTIVGILVIALGFSFEGWRGKYRIESQIKDIFADLADARKRAMTRNRFHFVRLTTTQYTIYEDDDPAPDGNGTLEDASDTEVLQKTIQYNRELERIGGALPVDITINTRGIMLPETAFRIDNTVDSDFDCFSIAQLRVKMGKYDSDTTTCITN